MGIKEVLYQMLLKIVRAPDPRKCRHSFSQEGEDMILAGLMEGISFGCYVDVGAHHPTRFSNTYHFYLKGWRGINIDPEPRLRGLFKKTRPGDIFEEAAVGHEEEILFHRYSESACNCCGKGWSEEEMGAWGIRKIESVSVRMKPLSKILSSHWPSGKQIDFLNVDVEGGDLQVLETNDWVKYPCHFVVVEDLGSFDIEKTMASPLTLFMRGLGFKPVAKTVRNIFFEKKQ